MLLRALIGWTLTGAAAAATGPLAKYAGTPSTADYVARAKMEDVERCLIEIRGYLPNVYRQPDRPDDVSLFWVMGGTSAGGPGGKVELHREDKGTHVRAWLPMRQIEACAPR